jgi:hypothetical protein
MGQVDCCQKNEPVEDVLNEIFASSPEDNKVPNDMLFRWLLWRIPPGQR